MANQNWLDYNLYRKAEFNYVSFQVKQLHPTISFFEFLVPIFRTTTRRYPHSWNYKFSFKP